MFSLLAVTVKLWSDLGAEKIIFDVKAANAHRIWDVLDLDPTKRSSSAWIVGEISLMFFNVGTGQYFVQRYVSCATVKDRAGHKISALWEVLWPNKLAIFKTCSLSSVSRVTYDKKYVFQK